jgi:hypothetical protein
MSAMGIQNQMKAIFVIRRKLLFLCVCLCCGLTSIAAQAVDASCPLSARLTIGTWGKVANDVPNNLRGEPTTHAARIGQIPVNDIFRVVAGPRCADTYVWWQVNYAGTIGWTAEGNPANRTYWLESLAGVPKPTTDKTVNEPVGCLTPPDDYTRLKIGFSILNLRTLAMLDQAQSLYNTESGIIRFREAIMQGSYNKGGVAASFGTHDGGGAVDLSVRSRDADRHILTDEIAPMLRALRVAGFAAWLRDTGELYPGSPIHIHAIAIGDKELSSAARGQIDGTFGYLRGFDGLPRDDGIPHLDGSGVMLVCQWMVDRGFKDLRGQAGNQKGEGLQPSPLPGSILNPANSLIRFPDRFPAEDAANLAWKARTADWLADKTVKSGFHTLRDFGIRVLSSDGHHQYTFQFFVGTNLLQDFVAGCLGQIDVKENDVWAGLHRSR